MTEQIKFIITEDVGELTWDDWIALEGGHSAKTRDIMARFVVDAEDKPMALSDAKLLLGKVKVKELAKVSGEFWKALKEKSAPPPTGG
jgi:hypothetical protein